MDLSVKDIAKRLKVSGKTIYRMIKSEAIPSFRVGGQWRFHEGEILSWLEDAKEVSPRFEEKIPAGGEEAISISEFLQRGGIYYRIGGDRKEDAMREAITLMKIGSSREFTQKLLSSLLGREALCSTAMGHGIALPHPRPFTDFLNPLSSISLCFLHRPIPFQSMDGEDVSILFFIFPRSEARYLKIQSRLLRILREDEVISRLKEVPLREEIYELFSRKESEIIIGEKA